MHFKYLEKKNICIILLVIILNYSIHDTITLINTIIYEKSTTTHFTNYRNIARDVSATQLK